MPAPFFPLDPRHVPVVLLLAVCGVAVALLGRVVTVVSDLVLGRASAGWPGVAGTVEESFVVRRRHTNRGHSYRATVVYTYAVAGRTYRRRRRLFGAESTPVAAAAEAVAARYPAGAAVQVCHHPRYPGLAVLEPGVALGNALWRLALVGLGLAIVSPVLRSFLPAVQFHLGLGG